eukprot:TRINITY_DN9996_c1_g2_i1.p1 TRINITY_DN9996_c1_g2~~TRINITY_DN9996_c1_g2_i1.p1  ORF type:complete len:565 (+),score=55.99 TRINITY_DN9996_c1_g2_i1:116-1810(+)
MDGNSEAVASSLSATFTQGDSTTQAVQTKIALMSNFEIASRELLRGTPAHCPLRACGAALRNTPRCRPLSTDLVNADEGSHFDDFHPLSRPVTSIGQFWSHSWLASALLKVVVLLLEYNGLAAGVIGTVAAWVASALFAGDVLPGMTKGRGYHDKQELSFGTWGLSTGVLFFVLTLVYWRSGQTVFLDKICVSQTNEEKKVEGVIGIGAFLKSSQCLLVISDSTYVTRVWCVFELAAYSKLMENDPDKTLCFIPLVFGKILIVGFVFQSCFMTFDNLVEFKHLGLLLGVYVTCLALLSHLLRDHQAGLADFRDQLRKFRMEDSNCYCCTVGHVQRDTGARLSCDRDAVNACVDCWFGSSSAFNTFVQSSLSETFAKQVGRLGFPLKLSVFVTLPSQWAWMDKVAARLRQSQWNGALYYLGLMVTTNFICIPVFFAAIFAMARVTRRRLTSYCADMIVSLVVAVVATASLIAMQILTFQVFSAHGLRANLVFGSITVILLCLVSAAQVRRCLSGRRTRRPSFSTQQPIQLATVRTDITSDDAVSALGRGSDQLEEMESQDSIFYI